MPLKNFLRLRKPKWVMGLKRALTEAYKSNRSSTGELGYSFIDPDTESDNESVLGAGFGEVEESGQNGVPSLVDLCSRVIAENPELLPQMENRSNLSLRDIWQSVKAKRDREAEELRTKYTLSIKGNREPRNQLATSLARRIHTFDRVVSLVLDDCKGLDDGILLGLLLKGKRPALPHLKHLSLSSCISVTDASLVPIIKAYNVQMKSLCLSKSGATQKSVKATAKHCCELQVVGLSHLITVQDQHIIELSKNCSGLREVDVSYCKLITDDGVSNLASNLYHLEALNTSYCHKVGKSILQLRDCRFLQRLRLQDCPLVTDSMLMPVLGCCTLLEVLCIRGCNLITMSTIQKIADCCTNIRVLDVVGINANGNKALGVLAQSVLVRSTLQEYLSTDRVVLRLTNYIWDLFGHLG